MKLSSTLSTASINLGRASVRNIARISPLLAACLFACTPSIKSRPVIELTNYSSRSLFELAEKEKWVTLQGHLEYQTTKSAETGRFDAIDNHFYKLTGTRAADPIIVWVVCHAPAGTKPRIISGPATISGRLEVTFDGLVLRKPQLIARTRNLQGK